MTIGTEPLVPCKAGSRPLSFSVFSFVTFSAFFKQKVPFLESIINVELVPVVRIVQLVGFTHSADKLASTILPSPLSDVLYLIPV